MTNQTLGDRIRLARKHKGLSQAKLGSVAGDVSREAVSLWESGTNAPTADKLGLIASETGVRAEWLMSGVGPMEPEIIKYPGTMRVVEAEPIAPRSMARDVPVRGSGSCGPDGRFVFESGTIDYVRRPPRLAGIANAYALYTAGSSMSPWREELQLVYVLPGIPVQVGDHVVVQLRDQEHPSEAYIKKLVGRTGTELRLAQYNPPKDIRIPLGRVAQVHKIIDWSELLGI